MSIPSSATRREHWDQVYDIRGAEQVSWFQPEPAVSLELIDELHLDPAQPIIDLGAGTSTLVDRLLERGHTDVTVLDVSSHALERAQHRLAERAALVRWETTDLLRWVPTTPFVLWHDRAVFHFLTDPEERARYRELATAHIVPGGHLILATFAPDGPEHCSGLPIVRYSAAELAAELGAGFTVETAGCEQHRTPSGAIQPFTWLLLRRTET